MFCSKCGKVIPDNSQFCPNCGQQQDRTKFCMHCGEKIDVDCVVCPKCGKQVAEIKQSAPAPVPQVVINNKNDNVNTNVNTQVAAVVPHGRAKNKWVAFFLCLFLGYFGAHKFYEGKFIMGIIYLFTCGLFMIGAFVDLFAILAKPKYYY